MSGAFTVRKTIRFGHCDPAGIVYYPRYLDLLHEAKEDWLRDGVGVPLSELIGVRRRGLPIVRLEADFLAPSRLGDDVEIDVGVGRVGGTSLHVHYELRGDGRPRLRARSVVVHVRLDDGRPVALDGDLRERLARYAADGGGR